MPALQTLIRNVQIVDGTGSVPWVGDVGIAGDSIVLAGPGATADACIDGEGLTLAPGFIDVHTHDDLVAIRQPEMLPKLSQGVTTSIVGNCGISAAPVALKGDLPDPMNLLGSFGEFVYPDFASYVRAVEAANPAVNIAALVGHTALRNNHMDRLDRAATEAEIEAMRTQLEEALAHGALGLSTGLAYLSAFHAPIEEVISLAEPLADAGAIYTTHMRNEADQIGSAMAEAMRIGRHANVPVVISHLKCAGYDNWGYAEEIVVSLEEARTRQEIGWDCYPYAASSSTLDLRQVDERIRIAITWSDPHPEMTGKTLADIANAWDVSQVEAARRLQPAGAIYHCMAEDDVRAILQHPATMIGSDGLPCDPRPHPRLWGAFPRVLGHFCREETLFSLSEAVHKMTGLSAMRFGLNDRGTIAVGKKADLVLFDANTIADTATFEDPTQVARGIHAVWVNGVLSFENGQPTGHRAGRFLTRQNRTGWK